MLILLGIACVDYQSTDKVSEHLDTSVEIEDFEPQGVEEDCYSNLGREVDTIFTPHFQLWLQERSEYQGLTRSDLLGGSFGGLVDSEDCLERTPVVFVHGNSDRAQGGLFTGWSDVLPGYLRNGYRSAELYGTTYGDPETMTADEYTHDQANVMQVRRMIEAVLDYTGSDTIHIVAHSLGVTIARRAILGGLENDSNGSAYDIGSPLTDSIDAFIGIAGANLGLASCTFATTTACNDELGLYPGTWNNGTLNDQSTLLTTLNANEHYEGQRVYSIWGESDGLLGQDTLLDCLLYGENTCQIPGQDNEYNEYLNHFDIRNDTVSTQLRFLRGD